MRWWSPVCACMGDPLYGTTGAVYPYPGIRKSGRPIAETGPVRITRRLRLIRNMFLPSTWLVSGPVGCGCLTGTAVTGTAAAVVFWVTAVGAGLVSWAAKVKGK